MKSFTLFIKAAMLALCFSQMAVAAAPQVVNINTADAATLDRVLVGIGPSKAQAIVAYRKAHGAFRSVDALMAKLGRARSGVSRPGTLNAAARAGTPAPA